MKTLQELQSVVDEKELEVSLGGLVENGIVCLSGFFYHLEEIPDPSTLTPLEREIVNALRPKLAVMVGNTQSGKTLKTIFYLLETRTRSIPFILSSNDQGLCGQLKNVFANAKKDEMWSSFFPDTTFQPFLFSSREKTSESLFQVAALDYQEGRSDTIPVGIFLANSVRMNEISRLIRLCATSRRQHYSLVFDEGDQTYTKFVKALPEHRLKEIRSDPFCYQIIGVTATAEKLKEVWPDALVVSSDFDDMVELESEHYRAMHTKECEVEIVEQKGDSSNEYARRILLSDPRFKQHTQVGFRRIIVKANAQISDQRALSSELRAEGFHTLVVNMTGVEVNGQEKYKIEGRLNRLLYKISKGLRDKPLVVIGNRKIDRGVTFHYTKRKSLIFTDMILPNIADADSAVQAAGRLAGNIADARGYIGSIRYWTTEKMRDAILSNNQRNLIVNQIAKEREVLYAIAAKEAHKRLTKEAVAKQVDLPYIQEKLNGWVGQLTQGARFLRIVDVEEGYYPEHPIFTELLGLTRRQAVDLLQNFSKGERVLGGGGYGMLLFAKVEDKYFFLDEVKPLISDFQR